MEKLKYKLVCFDLDGTLVDETIFLWETLHNTFNCDKEIRRKAKEDYLSGKITYEDWANIDIKMWRENGITKQHIFDVVKQLRLMDGALETLEELKKRGCKLAIISGSIDIALEFLLPDYKDIFDEVLINELIFDNNGKIIGVLPTKFDFEHKATGLKKIAKKHNIKLSETVFVGDNHNDVKAAEVAGLSIAFNCKSNDLASVADILTKTKDLREILKYLR